ncbi:HxlR family transcriptional regulator [Ignicoccus pacificus DSM 13166]|uniref:HxlR family transcriptional regulator n=1 Tax=Ignicoccus pacificus DSM 13166 TaxID=940294 RepID=A0A977KA44_9CREN|nr:HxlR family transcriptional regulator [Ignicoccus pacificus DSM 13166]
MKDLEAFEEKVKEILNNCIREIEQLRYEVGCEEEITPQQVKERLDKIRPSLELLTSKWVPDIMYALLISGEMGFNELKNSLGISSRVLSDKLQELVRAGIVKREEKMTGSARRVKYSLTPKGRKIVLSLTPFLFGIYLTDGDHESSQ